MNCGTSSISKVPLVLWRFVPYMLQCSSCTRWHCWGLLFASSCLAARHVPDACRMHGERKQTDLTQPRPSPAAVLVPATAGKAAADRVPLPRWDWTQTWDAQRAHIALLVVLLAGSTPVAQSWSMSAMVYLMSLAVCTIYIGSHKGLTTAARQQVSVKEARVPPASLSGRASSLCVSAGMRIAVSRVRQPGVVISLPRATVKRLVCSCRVLWPLCSPASLSLAFMSSSHTFLTSRCSDSSTRTSLCWLPSPCLADSRQF
jgi:hypothetical protein